MSRRGFALPLALIILIAASMMVATALQVSVSDFHANRATRVAARALYAAEAGVDRTLALWESLPYEQMSPGDSVSSGWVRLPDGSVFQSVLLRVDDGSQGAPLFRLLTEGRPARESSARRVILTMLQGSLGSGAACCDAALSVYGRLDVSSLGPGGGTQGGGRNRVVVATPAVDGIDQVPVGWGAYCPTPGLPVAGIAIHDLSDLDLDADAVALGSPPVIEDRNIDTDLARIFAATTYDALVARADIRLTGNNERLDDVRPRSRRGECDTSDEENWGAPDAPGSVCWSYLPVIHAARDLRLSGSGSGQGILLVDRDLDVEDEFRFYGLVVVRGRAEWNDESSLAGALLVGNRDQTSQRSRLRDQSRIKFSSCAIARALPSSGGASVQLLPGRHWFEIQ